MLGTPEHGGLGQMRQPRRLPALIGGPATHEEGNRDRLDAGQGLRDDLQARRPGSSNETGPLTHLHSQPRPVGQNEPAVLNLHSPIGIIPNE